MRLSEGCQVSAGLEGCTCHTSGSSGPWGWGQGRGDSPDRDPPALTAFMDTIQVGFAGIDLRNGNNSPTRTVSIFTRTGSSDPEMATLPHTSPQERLHVHTPRQQGPGEDRALKRICARAFSAARLLSSWHPGWPLAQHTCPGLSLSLISAASLQVRGCTSSAVGLLPGLCGQRPASPGGLPCPLCFKNTSPRTPQDPAFSPSTSHAAGFPCLPALCCQ